MIINVYNLINEHLYWLNMPRSLSRDDGYVLIFSLANELFNKVPFSKELSTKVQDEFNVPCCYGLFVTTSCLWLSIHWEDGNTMMWMMKQYGLWDSWVRLYHWCDRSYYHRNLYYRYDELFGFTIASKILTFSDHLGQEIISLKDPNLFSHDDIYDVYMQRLIAQIRARSLYTFITPLDLIIFQRRDSSH